MRPMEPQLFLLPDTSPAPAEASDTEDRPLSWRLDDATRARGRQGIARARAALRQATTEPARGRAAAPRRAAA